MYMHKMAITVCHRKTYFVVYEQHIYHSLHIERIIHVALYIIPLPKILTLVLLIFFLAKMLSALYVCCLYSNTFQTNFITQANTMNPDQTAPKGAV